MDENSDPKTAKKHPACIVPLYIALHCSAACLWIQCCPPLASAILIFLNIINSNFLSSYEPSTLSLPVLKVVQAPQDKQYLHIKTHKKSSTNKKSFPNLL